MRIAGRGFWITPEKRPNTTRARLRTGIAEQKCGLRNIGRSGAMTVRKKNHPAFEGSWCCASRSGFQEAVPVSCFKEKTHEMEERGKEHKMDTLHALPIRLERQGTQKAARHCHAGGDVLHRSPAIPTITRLSFLADCRSDDYSDCGAPYPRPCPIRDCNGVFSKIPTRIPTVPETMSDSLLVEVSSSLSSQLAHCSLARDLCAASVPLRRRLCVAEDVR
jgi:hypothetical protein